MGGASLFTPFAWEGSIFDHHAICLLIISAKPGSLAKGLISERDPASATRVERPGLVVSLDVWIGSVAIWPIGCR